MGVLLGQEPFQHIDCGFDKNVNRTFLVGVWLFTNANWSIHLGGGRRWSLCQDPILRRWWERSNSFRHLVSMLVVPGRSERRGPSHDLSFPMMKEREMGGSVPRSSLIDVDCRWLINADPLPSF